jgi:bacterial/archaeal transporter family protein
MGDCAVIIVGQIVALRHSLQNAKGFARFAALANSHWCLKLREDAVPFAWCRRRQSAHPGGDWRRPRSTCHCPMPRWLFWTLLTLLAWGLWAVLSKLSGGELSGLHLQAISTLGLVPILVTLWFARGASTDEQPHKGIPLALAAGVFSSLGNVAFYAAMSHGKAATIVPLTALSPVITILLAIPLLKESFNRIQFAGICVSLVAIFLFNVQPETGESSGPVSQWLPMALVAVGLWGVTGLLQKMSTNHLSAQSSAIWFLAAFIPVAGSILLYDPVSSDISTRTWMIAAALGFTLALGNLTILLAFSSGGEASIIPPLAGLYPIVSIPIAIAVLHERISTRETLAIALALAAVVMLSYQPSAAGPAAKPANHG